MSKANRCDKKVRFKLNPNSNESCIKRSKSTFKTISRISSRIY